MDDNKPAAAREKPAKPAKAKPQKAKESAPKRRERPIDAKDVFVPGADSGEASMNDLFRMRLAYLMNGNNSQGKSVNIQELADAVGVSRPAIRPRPPPSAPSPVTSERRRTSCSASTRRTLRPGAARWRATTTTPSASTSAP